MPRKPNPAPHPFQDEDELAPIEELLTGDAAWLVPALMEGLLSHVPASKRNPLRKGLDWSLRMYLTLFRSPHPFNPLPSLSEDEKRDIITKRIATLRVGKPGQRSRHSLEKLKQHAVMAEKYLQTHPFPFKARNQASQNLWLRQHLLVLLADFQKVPCRSGHCQATSTLPAMNIVKALGRDAPTPATLPRMIVGYYHGLKAETVTKLLYPGTPKEFAATVAHIREWMNDPTTFHDRMKAVLLS